MNRRDFLRAAAAISYLSGVGALSTAEKARAAANSFSRVRPGDAGWPSRRTGIALPGHWRAADRGAFAAGSLCGRPVGRRLRRDFQPAEEPVLPRRRCRADADPRVDRRLDIDAQRLCGGGADAPEDVVAAVNFARENNLRLVVKGGGHSYQGTSNAPDSLLIWTRRMNEIDVHDSFVGRGLRGTQAPQPAVTVEAGARWLRSTRR